MAERKSESGEPVARAEGGDVARSGMASGPERAPDAAGRGKPPVGRRFSKGKSGNPAGRPPKVRGGSGMSGDRLIGSDRPTRLMILEEAYRTITVRDGDTEVEIPANRAVFRAMMERALKGSRIAQRKWIEMVEEAELQQRNDQLALYNMLELPKRKTVYRPGDGRNVLVLKWSDDIVGDPTMGRTVVRRVEEE